MGIHDETTTAVPMEEDNTSIGTEYELRQDPNDWIPKAEEARRDAEVFLPRIIAAILDGARAKDWNRQVGQLAITKFTTRQHIKSCVPTSKRLVIAQH